MKKRKTKKQKQNIKYHFVSDSSESISWGNNTNSSSSQTSVKREKTRKSRHILSSDSNQKNTSSLAEDETLAKVKKDIFKTLIVTSLILCMEVMLYWFRFK